VCQKVAGFRVQGSGFRGQPPSPDGFGAPRRSEVSRQIAADSGQPLQLGTSD